MIQPEIQFKDLLTALSHEQGQPYVTVWTLPQDLNYLEGHFPELPILPAVGILDATLYFLRRVLQKPLAYIDTVSMAKFLSPISPGTTVRIEIQSLGNDAWQADWKDEQTAKLLATLRVHLSAVN